MLDRGYDIGDSVRSYSSTLKLNRVITHLSDIDIIFNGITESYMLIRVHPTYTIVYM